MKLSISKSIKPSFDGETLSHNFRRQFEVSAECNHWINEEKAIELLLALMRKSACNFTNPRLQEYGADHKETFKQFAHQLGESQLAEGVHDIL